jgi:hypothetical protein
MMNISKKLRRKFSRAMREFIASRSYGSTVETNAAIRAALDANIEDGKIALYVDGRDCDGVQYSRSYVMDAWKSVAAFKQWDEERINWLDGPESITLGKPSEFVPINESRDLVAEAFENGHPHVIYAETF